MKEFILKYKVVIAIVVLLALFILLSVLLGDNIEAKVDMKSNLEEWTTETKEDKYVVTVIAQTTCSHCIAFKPTMQKVANKENLNVYWFEANTLSEDDYKTLSETYELDGYQGTPYTFVTKNGKFVDYLSGEASQGELRSFLEDNKVIK